MKTQPSDPAVSVLMAVYNCAPYLPAALDSVLGQSFSDYEFIVVDDASTDETPAILSAYTLRDNRFVLLRNERNLKLPASLNRGLAVCRAPLIARADGDDLCHPKRLVKQVEFLNQHPEVGAISCSYNRIDADGRAIGFQALPTESAMIKFKLLWESTLSHAGALYRARAVRAVGGYDETFVTAQDYDLWARLADSMEFANLSDPLLTVRTHAACATTVRAQETVRLGHNVSQRLLSRYLGRSLSIEETAALTGLLCAFVAVSSEQLSPALRLLDELWGRAKSREDASTWRWARREISRSLLKQSYLRTYSDPINSWRLLRKASAVSMQSLLSQFAFLQILRLLLRSYRHRGGSVV
jgi:glycosyltransferase involved in cell wall biosynthesis